VVEITLLPVPWMTAVQLVTAEAISMKSKPRILLILLKTFAWEKNQTRLHTIKAKVKLNKFTKKGAYLKQYGEVRFAD